ncbi:MAG: hypothetical protein EXR72_24805 [Myxococcales bacterium]|nr:hypothetical protein [Myxococcales bacterium]
MNRQGDRAEHARLLASRARTVAATWRRVRRAVSSAGWTETEKALLATVPAKSLEASLVALAGELDDLTALEARLADHTRGDPHALGDLVDWFLESEQVRVLMPRGKLPRHPAPTVKRLIAAMRDDLLARLVIQWVIDAPRAPAGPRSGRGALTLRPRYAPSWGHTTHSLLLGGAGALLVSRRALPRAWRFTWDAGGWSLAASGARLSGRFGDRSSWQVSGRALALLPVPRVSEWPLLPPVVDEDGRSRARPLYPPPGTAKHAGAIFGRAAAQTARIEKALAVLAAAWPEGARTVRDFTRAILPVTQSQVVSYSFAPVPGWSYLNLYHRDFVDLIDDLVHENAHHHLNHILADDPLLVPPRGDESLVYYSPWRETLRPLRGILHSVFTFAAGAELFRRLLRTIDENRPLPHRFTASERRKIAARCLEETVQVRYALIDLSHAFRAGRITPRGHELIRRIARAMTGFDRLAPSSAIADVQPAWSATLRSAIAGTREARRLARLEATLAERRALARRLR